MASKREALPWVYAMTIEEITSSDKDWRNFLKSACRNYKCSFDEQVLIYAQRPDATAVLEIHKWNSNFGRWVNRGATGIAVFDKSNTARPSLKYYFDISDTHETKHSRPVPIWSMQDNYIPDVIDTLEGSFGELNNSDELTEAITSTSENVVSDNISDYFEQLLPEIDTESKLQAYENDETEELFSRLVKRSISYMVQTRLAIDADDNISTNAFSQISLFNTPETANALGLAASDITEMVLREVSATILTNEKEENRTIAKDSVKNNNKDNGEIERSENHDEDNIQQPGRLQSSELGNAETGSGNGEIRESSEEISDGEKESDIHQPSDHRETEFSSERNTDDSNETDGPDDKTDDETGEPYGEDEGGKSNEMDETHEQHQEPSGRDDNAEPDNELAYYDRSREDKSLPFFSFKLINPILKKTPFLKATKSEIRNFYSINEDDEARTEYIKSIFNNDYTGLDIGDDDLRVGYKTMQNVLHLWEGNYLTKTSQGFYDWGVIADHIDGLILLNDFYDDVKPLPSQEGQLSFFSDPNIEEPDTFSEGVITRIMKRGSSFQNGKFRIYEQYQKQQTNSENAKFLKDEYGTGGSHPAIRGTGISEDHSSKGQKISDGEKTLLLKWSEVARRIGQLIADNNYLAEAEKEQYEEYISKKEQRHLERERDNESAPLLDENPTKTAEPQSNDESTVDTEAKETSEKLVPPTNEDITDDSTDFHPEISVEHRLDFKITDNDLGTGSAKLKYENNINAIRLIKTLNKENRLATSEEQEVLSEYVGWGGLSQAFDEQNTDWSSEYQELKELLNEEEYTSARASTLTAFYTPPTVINAMYKTLENMGFSSGNILEPSCGTGNFIGLLPDSINANVTGVEIDQLTGQMAKQLYQKQNISIQGFEDYDMEDNFFDVAIGNVPFGSFKVNDKRYDKHNFLIHDYFFAKTMDKVRSGGIIAFLTSKGTLDKKNPSFRKYLAKRADLLGAIRLPNNAFLSSAGTNVTSDILFLQKRERPLEVEPDWIHLGQTESKVPINSYFVDNPHMILGEMSNENSRFGKDDDTTCKPFSDQDLETLLNESINEIHAEIDDFILEDVSDEDNLSIPADPNVRNFSFTLIGNEIFYRENSRMYPVQLSVTATNRVKGMIDIRDSARKLITYQSDNYPAHLIKEEQQNLNQQYDKYTKKYGLLNTRGNSMAFSEDSSYPLLCSLEILDENGNLDRKADMFTKRTIRPQSQVTSVDTASEALAVSIADKAKVDIAYMSNLTGKSEDTLVSELKGVIYKHYDFHKDTSSYQTADEFLSGNIREKISEYESALDTSNNDNENYSIWQENLDALESVKPEDIGASDISIRLGSTWLPVDIVNEFVYQLFDTPEYAKANVITSYSEHTSQWYISNKNYDSGNVKVAKTYGTNRINGYKIVEDTLNLKDVRIFDTIQDDEGKEKRVLNKKATMIAQGKQDAIKDAFDQWVWTDPDRRERLSKIYNDKFNAIKPREYDGSHIKFSGMNPEITLNNHQVNAVARSLYGGNSLYAHTVGAGKTYEMVAAAMESKRLGLCSKNLITVPNHITGQIASEWLQLYPAANILVATKKDFEKKNRKKFCARIATGDYDGIIIGHSQFQKIPVSMERQKTTLQSEIDEITQGIEQIKYNDGERFTVKQLERTKKTLQVRLDKLNDRSDKDDVITFEELGVDRLFVDEAHNFKNLFLYTKMRNVAGISQTEAQKSSDLFMKCRYIDEITDSKGIVFATGTPISNSMTELYTMQRYLQYELLKKQNLIHFDSWASTFGETVTAVELSPEGTGYRAKTRFAKFYNLPELMSMFREVADIQTADMLNLPVPKANHHNVVIKPSDFQKEIIESLADRAEEVRNGLVDATKDNMLLITNDGRKLALDQRLINEMLPFDEDGKVSECINNVFDVYEKTSEKKLTQIIFCDLSTPKKSDDSFSVYTDIKSKLTDKGIPDNEIAFIHDATTETQKQELFAKVRQGTVRVLLGSTSKMGSGTNCQDKLVALHDLDCPWRPSDLEQRLGRIVRQGNTNDEVDIYRYVTEGTFDSYLYQLVENKQKFISQIMTSKTPVRVAEDIDETVLSYAEIKALATGNPLIIEKSNLDLEVSKLKTLRSSFMSQRYELEDMIIKKYPNDIKRYEERISGYEADISTYKSELPTDEEQFPAMTINNTSYSDKKKAGTELIQACYKVKSSDKVVVGDYCGFQMEISFDSFEQEYQLTLKNELSHNVTLGSDSIGNITRIDNALKSLSEKKNACVEMLENTKNQLDNAKGEVTKPFQHEDELNNKVRRLNEVNSLLGMDENDHELLSDASTDIAEELSLDNKQRDEAR